MSDDSRLRAALPLDPPFQTRAALHAWLQQHGIGHVARLNLEAVAPLLDPKLWPQLRVSGRRRRLTELASAEQLSSAVSWLSAARLLDALPPAVWRFLEQERADAERARASVAVRLRPPEDARAAAIHERLLGLRARLPAELAPRLEEALPLAPLTFDAKLPGFRFKELLPFESARGGLRFVRPEVRIELAPGACRTECTCGALACVHQLAAIDTALLWLRNPPRAVFERALEVLSRPAWQRTLDALDEALQQSPAAREGLELWWRLNVVDDVGVEVHAWVRRHGKKARSPGGVRMSRTRLLLEHGALLDPEDARIAALLPVDDGFASRALLEALIDHPRLVFDDEPDCPVRVERAPLGIVAEERNGAIRVSAGIDGTALPPPLLDRLRRARPDDVLFLWDMAAGARRLTLLDARPELRAMVRVLHRDGELFPPESRDRVLQSLAKYSERLPVMMPRSLRGEAVPSALQPVFRFEALDAGHVRVELLVRPIAEGPALAPGSGIRDVHVRWGEKAVHAVRDLKREDAFFGELVERLPLADAEPLPQPFAFLFPSAHGALELLGALSEQPQPPEVEWVGRALRTVSCSGPKALRVSLQRRHEWFGLLGELSVEGERVELARLLDAVRRKERFVHVVANTWLEVDEALRQHLAALEPHVQRTRHWLEIGPSGVGPLRAIEVEGAALDADPTWRRLVERMEKAGREDPVIPAGLQAELRPYQREGFRWLARLASWGAGGVLADDMGLGKTVQALALLLHRAALGPALVVAPASVAFNWREEAARFAPSLRITVHGESPAREEALSRLGPGDVLVLSYGLLTRDAKRLATVPFATAVFDEAQQLKNVGTQRVRAARGIQAEFKVALSGTPFENHLGELWSIFTLVFPGLLGSWESFRSRFAARIERQVDPEAAPALAKLIAPFLLRRTKAQVEAELPPKTEIRVPVVLSSAEWQLYEDARLAALSDLETSRAVMRDQERRVEVLAALTRLRLIACHPRLYLPRSPVASSKLERALELIEQLCAEGQRALVFSQFTSHLALLREALDTRGIAYVHLDGQTPQQVRSERVRAFQEGDAPLFLISLRAGGFGLNLTAATNVIHLDPWWNPAVEDQASDRAHRLGQDRPVTVYRLVSRGTIEEQMLALHEQKRGLVAQILEGREDAGSLSTDELIALLEASPPSA